jgi:hypothetical protein
MSGLPRFGAPIPMPTGIEEQVPDAIAWQQLIAAARLERRRRYEDEERARLEAESRENARAVWSLIGLVVVVIAGLCAWARVWP